MIPYTETKNDTIDACDKELDNAVQIICDVRSALEDYVDDEEVTEALDDLEQSIGNLQTNLTKNHKD